MFDLKLAQTNVVRKQGREKVGTGWDQQGCLEFRCLAAWKAESASEFQAKVVLVEFRACKGAGIML